MLNIIGEEGNGKPSHKIHFLRKILGALSLVSARLEIEYAMQLKSAQSTKILIQTNYTKTCINLNKLRNIYVHIYVGRVNKLSKYFAGASSSSNLLILVWKHAKVVIFSCCCHGCSKEKYS